MKNKFGIVIGCLIATHSITHTSIIVKGNDTTTSPYGFNKVITTRLLDPSSGIFYVGLNGSEDAYNLSKAGRYNGQPSPNFIGFAPSGLQDDSINYLALSTAPGQTADLVGSDASNAKTVFILGNDGSKFSRTTDLNDSNGATTGAVSGIAANGNYIVAAVDASAGGWGAAGSGLALIQINNDLSLTPKNAQTGTNGNLAKQLDATAFEFTLGGNAVNISATAPQMLWDQQLELFYVGNSMATAAIAGSYALAVAKAFVNPPNNDLELGPILPTPAAIDNANQQIVVTQSTGSAMPLAVNKLAIMHASTGPTYLIVAGGNTTSSKSIYALPLVDNPTATDGTHGTLANFNSALTNGAFTVAAALPGELLNLNNASDAIIATVGATALPMSVNANLSDMVVVGDTVYASINAVDPSTDDPGIFYSQALFNAEGKINGWTPWTKKVIPTNAFPNVLMPNSLAFDGTIAFFQVDLVNGKIWYIDNQTKKVVGSSSWTSATYAPNGSLAYELNNAMPIGVTAVLDLDQGTRGFTDPTTSKGTLARYALFGGNGLVAFARTSVANSLPSALNSVQTAQTDFTNSENFLVTKLPKNAGLVQTLEYSRQLADVANGNYFFAGTSNGLYAFADSAQAGFTLTPGNVNALDQAPFNGQWYTISTIKGSVIAMRTSGNALYVLTQQALPTLQSTVYKIPFAADLPTMFASSAIKMIAQTGNTVAPNSGLYTNFKNTAVFNDIAITFLDIANPAQEQLVIAASNGIYCSEAATGINNATSSNDAQWFSIDISKNGLPFLGIATVDNAAVGTNNTAPASIFPTTQWPFALTNYLNNRIFNTGSLYQLGSYDSDPVEPNPDFVPLIFTSINGDAAFSTLNSIINFNTDGARRFFVLNMDKNNRLMSLPFDVETWDIPNQTYALVNDAQLEDIHAIYWIRPIGFTGTIFMGTNKGVYTLN